MKHIAKHLKFDEYDMNKLKKAERLLKEVYEYNYTPSNPLTKRLWTIIYKLNALMRLNDKED